MKSESKVGVLVVISIVAIVGFSYFLGVINPFSDTEEIFVTYNFAGGIEVGSPVRVMGIKAGKVKEIIFEPGMKAENGEEVNLKLRIAINRKAFETVRTDSQFFINLAGVIGEKYLEVAPGSSNNPRVSPGGTYRGEDPPRIDQLISQSYSLAGKLINIVENNEGDFESLLNRFNDMVKNLNTTLVIVNKLDRERGLQDLIANLNIVLGDVKSVSGKLKTKDAEKTLDLLHRLMWRLDDLDKKAIKEFLQEEGIKAKIF